MFNIDKWQNKVSPFGGYCDPISAAIGAGGAIIGAKGSKDAAKTAAGAQNAATQAELEQYYQTREDYAPWREAGLRALGSYEEVGAAPSRVVEGDYIPAVSQFSYTGGDMYSDPGYQFRLQEGERAANRAMAGMGKLMSGNRLRSLMELGQDMASQEYGAARGRALQDYQLNVLDPYSRGVSAYGRAYGAESDYLNRLASLANVGQTATANTVAAQPDVGSRIAAAGQTQAAGQLGASGAWSSAFGDIGRQLSNYYNQPKLKPDYTPVTPDKGFI